MKRIEVSGYDTLRYGSHHWCISTKYDIHGKKRIKSALRKVFQRKSKESVQTQVNNIMRIKEVIGEAALTGATKCSNIATVVSHILR